MKLKTLIVDDEPLAREGVASYVEDVEFLELIGECKDAIEANQFMREHETDLVFLDIQMPKMSGTDFLRSLKHPPLVILTTAYPQYALEGFELDVVDYLVKPYSIERFLKAANRAYNRLDALKSSQTISKKDGNNKKNVFFVKSDRRYIRVNMDDVRYIKSDQNYVHIHTDDDKIITLMTLKKMEDLLPSDRFMRIHKSYIVALHNIQQIEGNQVLIGDEYLPISKSRKAEMLKRVAN